MHWVHLAALLIVILDAIFYDEDIHEPLWLAFLVLAVSGTCRQLMGYGITLWLALVCAIAFVLLMRR